MSRERVSVHVLVPDFRDACRGRTVDEVLALSRALEAVLARFGDGWRIPAAGEAFFEGEPPWSMSAEMSPLDWGASLREALSRELRLEGSVGIAATEIAARLAARLAGPGGILLWMPGREEDLLEGVPVEELDELRPDQIARLQSQGVATLDALARLPPSEARALIGIEGEKVIDLVRVPDSRDGDPSEGGKSRAACVRLAKRLSRKMDREGVRARGLELTVDYADGATRERHSRMPRATGEPEELADAAIRLYRQLPASKAAISRISLCAFALDSVDQLDLFQLSRDREVRVVLGRGESAELNIDIEDRLPLCSADTGGQFQ